MFHYQCLRLYLQHGYDSGSESGRGSSPSCNSSGAMTSPDSTVSTLSPDQNNIAYVLKTLTTIVVSETCIPFTL